LKTEGPEEFNRKAGQIFKLSYHKSSGLRGRMMYTRNSRKEPFTRVEGLTNRKERTSIHLSTPEEEDRFLATEVPIGSRVMWSDGNPQSRGEDFENENTIKIGPNRYAAHPFGTHSSDEIRETMAAPDQETPAKVRAYIRRWIFIKEIEWYART